MKTRCHSLADLANHWPNPNPNTGEEQTAVSNSQLHTLIIDGSDYYADDATMRRIIVHASKSLHIAKRSDGPLLPEADKAALLFLQGIQSKHVRFR